MDRSVLLYGIAGFTLFMLMRRYGFMCNLGSPYPKKEEVKKEALGPTNVFDKGIQDLKSEMLKTFYYGIVVEPNPPKSCREMDASDCGKYTSSCEWMNAMCRPRILTQWSGWTIRFMAPATAFSDKFIEVEQIQGEGTPVLWKPGMLIRWNGKDPLGRQGIFGDCVITKVEQVGQVRRLWLDADEPLNYYWGRPEVQIINERAKSV